MRRSFLVGTEGNGALRILKELQKDTLGRLSKKVAAISIGAQGSLHTDYPMAVTELEYGIGGLAPKMKEKHNEASIYSRERMIPYIGRKNLQKS